jgi:hypothetical protein
MYIEKERKIRRRIMLEHQRIKVRKNKKEIILVFEILDLYRR